MWTLEIRVNKESKRLLKELGVKYYQVGGRLEATFDSQAEAVSALQKLRKVTEARLQCFSFGRGQLSDVK